jgi:AraC-like DNA-binding protein
MDAVERGLAGLCDPLVTGFWIRGPGGEPGFWSPQVFGLYGMAVAESAPPAEIVLRNISPTERARTWEMISRCAQGDADFHLDYVVRNPAGGARHLRSLGQRVRSTDGRIVLAGSVQDMTRIETLRAEVHALAQQLRESNSRGSGERAGRLSVRQWERVESLVQARKGRDLCVAELAARVKMSSAEFARRFKGTTGETTSQYLLRHRLELASAALRQPHPSLAQVAVDCGFFDQAHFTRHFKRRYGLTPGRFALLCETEARFLKGSSAGRSSAVKPM